MTKESGKQEGDFARLQDGSSLEQGLKSKAPLQFQQHRFSLKIVYCMMSSDNWLV